MSKWIRAVCMPLGTILAVLLLAGLALGAKYNEAPMLAERVKQGLLPPVEERLPEEPLVIEPFHEIGKYGGTWRYMNTSETFNGLRLSMYGNSLLRSVDSGYSVAPNIVQRWEHSDDMRTWTFYFRKGVKWSDGTPATVDDVLFWWYEMALNEEHSEPVPDWCTSAGKPMEVTKIDDFTVRFDFEEPSPFFLDNVAYWPNLGVGPFVIAPAHYLKQFHPKYNPEYTDFAEFEAKQEWWVNPEMPVLSEWMPVEIRPGERLVLERNPYYYAVDTEGNQLPYIDRVVVEYIASEELFNLKITRGEFDFQDYRSGPVDIPNLSLYQAHAEEQGYEIIFWGNGGVHATWHFNMNHPDPAKRELYENPMFRRALSHALDRPLMRDIAWFGFGELTTGTYGKAVEFYRTDEGRRLYEEWRDLAIEYDPEKAMAMLDEIGVIDRDGDGWREMPNGEPLTIRLDIDPAEGPAFVQSADISKENWRAIGINTSVNPIDGAALNVMQTNATFDIRVFGCGDGPSIIAYPAWVVPIPNDHRWAPLYGAWYGMHGLTGEGTELDKDPRDRTPPREKPPEDSPYYKLQKLYDEARRTGDWEARDRLVHEMIKIHIEYGPFFLGNIYDPPSPVLVKHYFKNVPRAEDIVGGGFVGGWITPEPAMFNPAQFFIDLDE